MRRTSAGFTLVELTVTVAIVAILASIAIPNYFRMIEAVHRSEANGLLSDLYGMENAFLTERQRYGCLDEVGFQIEGRGHMAVWICSDDQGCVRDGTSGNMVCPCLEAPDDWTGVGGSPFVKLLKPKTEELAWRPGTGGAPVLGAPVPIFPITFNQINMNTGNPAGFSPPILLPDDCAAVQSMTGSQTLTAGADNWCRRAIPAVIDVFWLTTNRGRTVNWEPIEDDPAHVDNCTPSGSGIPNPGGGGGGIGGGNPGNPGGGGGGGNPGNPGGGGGGPGGMLGS